ncbi:MAG TPA: FAD-dependent oxidoreductase [Chitinophaga sp.]|uniref:FAD-dependent oxidoreductase n=1 Tax=Chitinophaga sp. TaxID=1869181 RepID=UPI002C750D4E|nr:FAD-dependent oxidoreductase [Chitinophaga sp.]HVI44804.1 FAD-dependent oxidoreductase [Chitinophaga sp.]
MNRRNFIEWLTLSTGAIAATAFPAIAVPETATGTRKDKDGLTADVVIAGGGLGGFAAALAALRNGLSVVLTEETDWIGGQLTQQGVPPDEHGSIETHGAPQSYRDFRTAVRQYYIRNYPLTEEARTRAHLNPGDGSVSRLCHEPRVAVAVLNEMLAPWISTGRLTLLLEHKMIAADVQGSKVNTLKAVDQRSGNTIFLTAPYFIDATELGDLLPLTGTEFVTGSESRQDTGELHAGERANPENNQAFTMCFAMDYIPGEEHVIEKPKEYDFWRNFKPTMTPPWPGKLLALQYSMPITLQPTMLEFNPDGRMFGEILNLWNYRRIINKTNFRPGAYAGDITIVNWPQNDYLPGNLVGATDKDFKLHVNKAKQLSLSLLYWLQTEAPRPDGGNGWPGIRLRKDVMGTADGMAKYPYIRESRRIKSVFRILEEHVGRDNRTQLLGKTGGNTAAFFHDSVGVGSYGLDLHPSFGGNNYIHLSCLPFQIPLGALLPVRMDNLLPACKNIGTTHITNGCYRLHPVEWSIGEAVGLLVVWSLKKKTIPRAVREDKNMLEEFQHFIGTQGLETAWPKK